MTSRRQGCGIRSVVDAMLRMLNRERLSLSNTQKAGASKRRRQMYYYPCLELLEDRITPTGPILSTLASFNGSNGQTPFGGLAIDNGGNLYGTAYGGGSSNYGTVFEVAKGSNGITTLAPFNGTNGAFPNGVIMDASGNLYGTTYSGIPSFGGTVFEVAQGSDTITTLASFNNSNNGAIPEAGLTIDSNGNLYGTTAAGGAFGDGAVFEVVKGSNAITTLASFNGNNGQNPYAALIMDNSGNLYGTTGHGGTSGDGTVFEVAKGSNAITTLASFDFNNGYSPEGSLVMDANGNLYGTTFSGGSPGDGTVFEVAKGSGIITTLASFNGTNGEKPVAGLLMDTNGNLYGTTESGGASDDGTVFEVVKGSDSINTLASFDGNNGAAPESALVMDSSGNLYGTTAAGGTFGDGTVFELSSSPTTTLTSSSNPSLYGQPVTFTAMVTPPTPASEMPTGTVTFMDGSTVLNPGGTALNATGTATFTTSAFQLPIGPQSITAVYVGDNNYNSSTSSSVQQEVLLTPLQIRQAYGISAIQFVSSASVISGTGAGQTIAIIDQGNDGTIAGDLALFDSQFGVPDPPSLLVVGELGLGSPLPTSSADVAETSADVEWAHAIAPDATILLIETQTLDDTDLVNAIKTAKNLGASVVSMSFSGPEYADETGTSTSSFDDGLFTAPGTTYVAATGDDGVPASYPATSPNVVAVGATNLYLNTDGSWQKETAWSNPVIASATESGNTVTITTSPSTPTNFQARQSVTITDVGVSGYNGTFVVTGPGPNANEFTYTDTNYSNLPTSSGGTAVGIGSANQGGSGGGFSADETESAYQLSAGVNNPGYYGLLDLEPPLEPRATPDVSFVGGEATPLSIVAAGSLEGFYGTSVSAPCWAGLIAIADQGLADAGQPLLTSTTALAGLYSIPTTDFHDITNGYNGESAGAGYDLVSGIGTPIANMLIPTLVKQESSFTTASLQTLLASNSTPTLVAADDANLQADISAINGLTAPSTPATITIDLSENSYSDIAVHPPAGVTVDLTGNGTTTTIVGTSPALTVSAGTVIITNMTLTTATDAPTLLVTGGSLELRNDDIEESTGFTDAAISVTGGSLDLGTAANSGGNVLNINGTGEFVQNTTGNSVPAVGDTFEVNGNVQSASSLSFTSLTTTAGSSVVGQSVTFTATVTPDAPGSATPTGYVDFYDTTTNTDLETIPLCGGVATLSTSALGLGTHVIQASYGGDSNYLLSLDSLTQLVVLPSLSVVSSATLSALQGETTRSVLLATFTQGSATQLAGDYTATVSWGDGHSDTSTEASSPISIQVSGQTISVYGTHTYTSAGTENLSVTLSTTGTSATAYPTATLSPNVSSQISSSSSGLVYNRATQLFGGTITLTNTGTTNLTGSLEVELTGLPTGVTLSNASGTAPDGNPYILVSLPDGTLAPGKSVTFTVYFRNPKLLSFNYGLTTYNEPTNG